MTQVDSQMENTIDSNTSQQETMDLNMQLSNEETESDIESENMAEEILHEMKVNEADGSDIDDASRASQYSSPSSSSEDEEEPPKHAYGLRDRSTIKPAVIRDEEKMQESVPKKKTQESVPQKKTQESVPQKKTQESVPQQKTQESLSQKKMQASVPQEKTQESQCHQHGHNTRRKKRENSVQLMSPDDLEANDDDQKPKATAKIKGVLKETAKSLLPIKKRPKTSRTTGSSNSPSKNKSPKQGEDEPNIEAPKTILQVKSDKRSRKFEVAARRIKELQILTCWEDELDRNEKPKHQHFMFSYDEMVPEPHNAQYDRFKRAKGGQFFFMVPDDCDPKKLGEHLEKVGRAMKKGKRSGTNWKIVASILDYHRCLYGSKKFRSQGTNNQASKNNSLFGEGYN